MLGALGCALPEILSKYGGASFGKIKKNNQYCRLSPRVRSKAANQSVGIQYAQALLDTAEINGDLESVHSDMNTLSAIVNDNACLCDVMVNSLIPNDKK